MRTDWIRRLVASVFVIVVAAACGGGDADGATEATIQGDIVVVDPEQVQDALDARDADEPTPEVASATGADVSDEPADGGAPDEDSDSEIDVAEAEEDELDGLLNALTMFSVCISDRGFELEGFPGDGSGRGPDDFDQEYLTALAGCAAESGVQEAATSFGESQANLTPEEIEQTNFGLPVFKACLEDLGWEVGELVPDERGALGFGDDGFGLTPPGGGGVADFNTDDITACRTDAEQYVADNFDAGTASEADAS